MIIINNIYVAPTEHGRRINSNPNVCKNIFVFSFKKNFATNCER